MNKLEEFSPIFFPRSHAIVGASNNMTKFGGRFVRAQINFGYKGKLFLVNKEESQIFGMKPYCKIADIPDSVDFASILVPAPIVPQVLEECLTKGIKCAQIITSGFSELDEKGKQLEKAIVATAAKGIRVIGPNCFGVYCPRGGLTTMPGENFSRESGPIGCISQSGGYSSRISRLAEGLGMHFSKMVSYGNASDINECDLMEYFYEDPETKIIIGYIEGVKNGPRFFDLLKKVTQVKPVILWKSGLTESGARAVKSHTSSLSGQKQIWEALFRQTGAVCVSGHEELMDATLAFALLSPIKARKFAVIGAGGGTGVAAADSCEKAGIPLSNFTPELQQALRSIVPAQGTSVHNPIDLGGPFPPPQMLKAILETVFDSDNIDVIILSEIEMSIMPPFLKVPVSQQVWILANAQMTLDVREKFGKPLIIVLPERSNGIDSLEYECARRRLADFFHKHRVPVFLSLERATKALSKFIGYWERRDSIS